MGLTLRSATEEDRPTLEIVRRQAIEAAFADQYERSRYADLVASPDSAFSSWLAEERYLALLLETTATPVAYVVCDRADAEVLALYTSPDYEGRGHASRLLQRASDELAKEGAEELSVLAPEPSIGFFRSHGFTEKDVREASGIPRRLMSNRLGSHR